MTNTPAGTTSDRRENVREDEETGAGSAAENPLVGQRDDAPLSLEEVFDVLRNERRQHVLSYVLLADEDEVTLGELAEHIAAIENDKPIQALSSQERKRVYVALYQCHLPKLASVDVVEFDKDRGSVEPGANLDQLEPYLDTPTDGADDLGVPVQYVLLSGAGVVAYLLAAGLQPGGSVVGGVVLSAAVAVFAAMTYLDRGD